MIKKRLNNKGFTLVELLAVIVILAVVVGITIPTVMGTLGGAKAKAFQTAADTVADWVDREYALATAELGDSLGTVDPAFENASACGTKGASCSGTGKTISTSTYAAFIQAAGLKSKNIESVNVKIASNGKSCVTLTATSDGDYVNSTGGYTITGGNC